MQISIFQVDAFTAVPFSGNPAAVCPLEGWLDDTRLQQIAAENNLSETAFLVPRSGEFELRWFTPTVEVPLCGHATLAAAFVIFRYLEPRRLVVRFATKAGELRVSRDGERLAMSLPRYDPEAVAPPPLLAEGLGHAPRAVFASATKYLCVYDEARQVAALDPDFAALASIERGIIVTAPGGEYDCDFVSRFFIPSEGIPEDPVTGSAHCLLTPYWAARLQRDTLYARQISRRGGELWCRLGHKDVMLTGQVVPYLVGTIDV